MITEKDNLGIMIHMQRTLQERAYGYNFSEMDIKERVAFIKEMSIHATQEMHEMMYELPFFKPWKDYSNMSEDEINTAMDKAREEYVDFVHFFLNIGIALQLTSDDILKGYSSKNYENYRRQTEGYTHDVSYR